MTDKSIEEKDREKLLGTLSELGGKQVADDELTFEGRKFIVPASMEGDISRAIKFLERLREQREEQTSFSRTFDYRPWDGAAAMARALKRVTGSSGIGKTTYTFFGPNPPQMIEIDVDHNETVQVPWGAVSVPIFEGTLHTRTSRDSERGPLFTLYIEAPRKYAAAINGLFQVVQDELEQRSIYRGKAFDAKEQPSFMDTSVIRPENLVYATDTQRALQANIWRLIEDTDWARSQGIQLKRAVLLEGPYGTGKTEAANVTAKKCVENGWTFIQVRANKDDLGLAMQTARLYQPAVVFFEDIDSLADAEKTNGAITRLLDIFDGMDAKHNDVMVVLTTNHVNRIHKGMVRPGRLDGIIHIGALDQNGVEKLARIKLGDERLADDIDWGRVYDAMEGYMPAFVTEALKRVVLYSEDANHFTTADLVGAAEDLRPQFELMEQASEGSKPDRFESLLEDVVQRGNEKMRIVDYDDDTIFTMKRQKREGVS